MNGLIVFNSANDVVFQNFNAALEKKICDVAVEQGLLTEASTTTLDDNIVLQIFSPLISSQRIMHCQFDNMYTSFQCDENLNFTFSDLLGYSFIKIGQKSVDLLRRQLGVAIALARHFYGINLFGSQANSIQKDLYVKCLEHYENVLWEKEQAMLLEAIPQLLINSELKRIVRSTLDAALDRHRERGYQRCHAMMFVSYKFVGIASSKQALKLNASDLVFISLLTRCLQQEDTLLNRSVAVFLQGVSYDPLSGCVPCIVHLSELENGIVFIQVIEYANLQVASNMFDTFFVLQKIVSVQMQGDADALKPAYESLEMFIKQSLDAIKKAKLKGDELDGSLKKVSAKWENLRKMYAEFLKSYEKELLVRIESNISPLIEDMKQLFTLACCDNSSVILDHLPEIASVVEGRLLEFTEFLAVKAKRNISIEAYLEDFPGLVHFVYINRSSGLMIAPDLKNNQLVPKKCLWSMVETARNNVKRGHSTIIWKDKIFNYSYFLWFEDQSNGPLKLLDLQQNLFTPSSSGNSFKPNYEPGCLAADFYQQLGEVCFPKVVPGKIRCYELFCIHLGLVTPTCAVEHARRLVATIADVVGDDNF